jgi:nitrogen fixation protein NifU and related proteins
MNDDLQKKITEALADPKNIGEMPDADAVGTVGNAECGEMLRMWIKYKQQGDRRIIENATFQSFGCETAIAVASLATELIKGKTAEEALALNAEELSGELGALPPMKIHCAELVEGALRAALQGKATPPHPTPPSVGQSPTLLDKIAAPEKAGLKIQFLDPPKA